jgi:chaperonin GroEL
VKERKDRVDDALNATRAAVEEGIVPGGGVALLRAKLPFALSVGDNADQKAGINIVSQGSRSPDPPDRRERRRRRLDRCRQGAGEANGNFGFNAQTEEYGDMIEMGIIDPAKVVRVALQDAASVAGLLITTEAMIAEARRRGSGAMPGGGGMGGMGGMDF